MKKINKQTLQIILDITLALYEIKDNDDIIKHIKEDYDIDITEQDISDYYDNYEEDKDIDEDLKLTYKNCGL